jgi:hypothetical protein
LTYTVLKNITAGLLIGDNALPEEDVLLSLLQYALTTTAMQADSLHLMTLSTNVKILRLAQGDYLIRAPELPVDLEDPIDIDEELTFAVARYLASYLSREKGGIHVNAADRIIKDYNAKTYEILTQMEYEALRQQKIIYPACDTTPSTEFSPDCSTEFSL